MPCPPSSGGGHVAPLLISLAVGYAVLVFAKRESKPLNLIGKIIGWLVVVVAFVGLICSAAAGLCRMCPSSKKACGPAAVSCPLGGPRAACPMDKSSAGDEGDKDEKPEAAAPASQK